VDVDVNFNPFGHKDQAMLNEHDTIAIKEALVYSRVRFIADNVDALDQKFLEYTKGKNYVRLTLRRQRDLNRLMTRVHIDENGNKTTEDGLLAHILKNGRVILIDYNNSNPKLVESLNSLFDQNPYFKYIKKISPNVKIIGAISREKMEDYPGSFHS